MADVDACPECDRLRAAVARVRAYCERERLCTDRRGARERAFNDVLRELAAALEGG